MAMRMTQRKGIVLPAVIALLVTLANAAVFAARTYPSWSERSAAQALYDRSESDLHAVRHEVRSLETMGRGALAATNDLRVFLDEKLIDASSWSEVLRHLRDTADAAGVRLERVDHSEEPVQQLNATRWQMAAFGAGSYAAIRSWMESLRDGPGLLYVDRVEMGGSGGAVLSVELTLVALLRADATVRP